MSEINKLRQRLTNIGRNVTEYRMTVAEAKALVADIDALEKSLAEKPKVQMVEEVHVLPDTRILDGGTF